MKLKRLLKRPFREYKTSIVGLVNFIFAIIGYSIDHCTYEFLMSSGLAFTYSLFSDDSHNTPDPSLVGKVKMASIVAVPILLAVLVKNLVA